MSRVGVIQKAVDKQERCWDQCAYDRALAVHVSAQLMSVTLWLFEVGSHVCLCASAQTLWTGVQQRL